MSARVTVEAPELQVWSTRLPLGLKDRLKAAAALHGRPLEDVAAEAITEWLERHHA